MHLDCAGYYVRLLCCMSVAMSKKLELQTQELASKEYEVECLREQQETLMELKDNILKAILPQNSALAEEVWRVV